MATLLAQMADATAHEFACVGFAKVHRVEESHNGRIHSFAVPGDLLDNPLHHALARYSDLVGKWKPDLIHIHGTEGSFGLLPARGMIACPAVISLQGLLGPCSEWYHYFGNNSILDIVRMHRWFEILSMRGQWAAFRKIRKLAKREREIIAGNRFFMGRTVWDQANILALNPSAQYFRGGELLREAFWQSQWSLTRSRRHRVIFTNAGGYPRKGTGTLLDAVKLLLPYYPHIEIAIAGNISRRSGYGRFVLNQISELGSAAVPLGPLTAEEMVKELLNSHIFVSPSYIDNSPNAVCEAQLLGMPVISTYTGGMPSLIDDERTGLFYPPGDVAMLADKLREVFDNDGLAVRLGAQAREVAVKRHDPAAVVQEILHNYESIVGRSN